MKRCTKIVAQTLWFTTSCMWRCGFGKTLKHVALHPPVEILLFFCCYLVSAAPEWQSRSLTPASNPVLMRIAILKLLWDSSSMLDH